MDRQLDNALFDRDSFMKSTITRILASLILFFLGVGYVKPQGHYIVVSEILPEEATLSRLELSPSGNLIASITTEHLCVTEVDTGNGYCTPLPWTDNFTRVHSGSSGFYLNWSPDEQYVAFAKFVSVYSPFDVDIWIYDVNNQTFQNLTDDGIENLYLAYNSQGLAEVRNAYIDYFPLWGLDSQSVYFIRAIPDADDRRGLVLDGVYNVSLSDLSVELIHTLPVEFNAHNTLAASISPDGEKLAMTLITSTIADSINGIWMLDFEQETLQHIAPLSMFNQGWVEGVEFWSFAPFNKDLAWHGNNNLFIVLMGGAWREDDIIPDLLDEQYFQIQIEPTLIQPLNFHGVELEYPISITSTLLLYEENDTRFISVLELREQIQTLYLGDNTDIYTLEASLPAFTGNDRIVNISANGRVLVGGIIIQLPTPNR